MQCARRRGRPCVLPYPARKARGESRRMVGAEPTEGLHVREGHPRAGLQRAAGRGISVGFGQAFSGGWPEREWRVGVARAAREVESNGSR